MKSVYYDSNYLLKLQMMEAGSAEVRAHAASVFEVRSALHCRAEFASASFRKVREGAATLADYHRLVRQFTADCRAGVIVLLPLTDAILGRIEAVFSTAPPKTWLRAADALHLATAAVHGFSEIHSNDKHLLAAAPLFGLTGVNVIP